MTHLITPAGLLRHLITITDPAMIPDPSGQLVPNPTPVVVATVHAEALSVAGGEKIRGLMMEAEATDLLRIRYIAGIKPTMQISLDDRTLNILSARDVTGRRFDLYLQCKENTSVS